MRYLIVAIIILSVLVCFCVVLRHRGRRESGKFCFVSAPSDSVQVMSPDSYEKTCLLTVREKQIYWGLKKLRGIITILCFRKSRSPS